MQQISYIDFNGSRKHIPHIPGTKSKILVGLRASKCILPDGSEGRKLLSDFVWVSSKGHVFKVRRGYECDGNSTPLLARWYQPKFRELEPAFFHDMMFQFWCVEVFTENGWQFMAVDLDEANEFYQELHLLIGTRTSKAWFLKLLLTAFSEKAWADYPCTRNCNVCVSRLNCAYHSPKIVGWLYKDKHPLF